VEDKLTVMCEYLSVMKSHAHTRVPHANAD
jgi:hypothetical protein